MKKRYLIAAAAAALALPGLSFAAPTDAADAFNGNPGISAEDAEAFSEAHIAGLKAGLKLSPSQEKNWPALEAALRELAKAQNARMVEMREQALQRVAHPDAIAALRQRAKMLSARASDLERLSDAAKPLYESLDDAQKRRFGLMMRAAARRHFLHAMAFMREFHGHGHERPGFGFE
jgi:hypothetical protein